MRQLTTSFSASLLQFLSTHPVRDATDSAGYSMALQIISIHASREGCDFTTALISSNTKISIHASREGCDGQGTDPQRRNTYFYPRIP